MIWTLQLQKTGQLFHKYHQEYDNELPIILQVNIEPVYEDNIAC